eukprot:COSAG02_NODE_29190_length_574_cov_0.938947_1_plen_30_part_10
MCRLAIVAGIRRLESFEDTSARIAQAARRG